MYRSNTVKRFYLLFILFILSTCIANCQTTNQQSYIKGKRIEATDSFKLRGIWYKTLGGSGTQAGSGLRKENDTISFNLEPTQSYSEKASETQAYNFERISIAPISQWYDGVSLANYKDTLILLGGWNAGVSFDTVRQSVDGGVTWTFRGLLPFPVHSPVFIQASDGYGYLIGGDYLSTSAQRAKVYRTSDYRTWTLRTAASPFGTRILHAGVEFKGALMVGGGQNFSASLADGVFNDLYKSTDGGVTWALLSNTLTHMGKNISNTMAVFADQIWQVSGGKYDNLSIGRSFDRTVYSSPDGINWQRRDSIPYKIGVHYPSLIPWDGKLWLMQGADTTIGSSAGVNRDSVAYMDRGGSWHKWVTGNPKPAATHAAAYTVYKDHLVRAFGNTVNEVWTLSRSEKIYTEKPLYFKNKIRIDTLGVTSDGRALYSYNPDGGTSDMFFQNSVGNGQIILNSVNWELWSAGIKRFDFPASGSFLVSANVQAPGYIVGGSTATPYGGSYYGTSLQSVGNYPGVLWSGISQKFVLGLDGADVGFRQETGAATGIRMIHNIANGTLVLNNNQTAGTIAILAPSAMADFQSTTKGFLFPRMTAAQRTAIASPAEGLMVYDLGLHKLYVYDGTVWQAAW
ncbi:MAG: hypothetical protein H7258_05380 [Ferruginibacter sp.]|nr:hypothetical protein [Ferruginibacter sp.]